LIGAGNCPFFGDSMKYQFIGSGQDSPKNTVFMGKYSFTLNHKYVEITDEAVLAKIKTNASFKEYIEPVKKTVSKKVSKK